MVDKVPDNELPPIQINPPKIQPPTVGTFHSEGQDPWQAFLGSSATPQQIERFKEQLCRTISQQIAEENTRMIEALKKLRNNN